MKLTETFKSLFTFANEGYEIAQTISADLGMGNKLQREINNRYHTKSILKNIYTIDGVNSVFTMWDNQEHDKKGFCLYETGVMNLVVKRSWKGIPSYTSIRNALESMKYRCELENITQIVMPKIGTGSEDKLSWDKVKAIIEEVFADTDIEIVVSKYFIKKKDNDTANAESTTSSDESSSNDGFESINDDNDYPFK